MFPLEVTELKQLKNEYIEKRRKRYDGAVIDAAAHLLLELGNPAGMLRVGIDYLSRELLPCRIDAGLGSPHRSTWAADIDWRDTASDAPSTVGAPVANADPVVQRVWRSPSPVPYHDCQGPLLSSMADSLAAARTRSMVAQRIEHNGQPLGLLCIDQTTHARRWRPAELQTVDTFCNEFLSPLLHRSTKPSAPDGPRPSAAELAAIRLAAEGLSYKEIARALGKSIRTIEHQLRSARQKTGASNQADLVRRCLDWV